MDVSHIFDSLNDAQRQAVAAPNHNLLVLAGAGSGKTRVLVHRIAWLIEAQDVSPYSILAVTFTNKAAKEMRGRIEHVLERNVQHMWVGTFHSLAHRLLRTHWQEANLPEAFQILDSDDQLRVIKRVLQSLELDEKQWPARQAQWFINAQKDDGLRAGHIQPSQDRHQRTMLQIYSAYESVCERSGMVDFGELLLRSHEMWLKKPELLSHYQKRFRHILVDEFQDTNAVQYAWLKVLAGSSSHLMAVGDDDQSIYGWRGAKIENIQQFSQDFSQCEVIKLEQNYRSTGNILKAANTVIENNQGRLGKQLWTQGDDGEKISLYAAFNEQDEAHFIIDTIAQHHDKGRNLSDIGVLYRSNAQSRVIEEALLKKQIKYRVYGGQRFYERLEIKNALAYLRLLVNRHDDAAIERIINVPTRGIGGKTLMQIRSFARDQGTSLWRAANDLILTKQLSSRAASSLQQFFALIDTLDQEREGKALQDIVEQVIDVSGLIGFHAKEKGEKGQARVENLKELISAAAAFICEEEEAFTSELAEFLSKTALDAGDAQADQHEDAVQMMTLHSAKGLEFELVFLCGLEEGLFPHEMSVEEPGRLEEERRLCYVGITRAMEKLYLTYAESRRIHGRDRYNSPSRFIRELPEDVLDEVRLRQSVSRPVSFQRSSSTSSFNGAAVPGTAFKLGQQVRHAKFGVGTVLNFEGQDAQARIQVNFETEGTKWLVVSFAKLEALM